ncbi:MAG: NusG domain II-containing protein [Chitinispirillales bacterium]|jgi:hypothetical protein|nr:NusG domain II-containing protein [Chitinispirillales bacterium]
MHSVSESSSNFTETIRRFGVADAIIIAMMTCAVFLTSDILRSGRPDIVTIFRQNTVIASYPLNIDAIININGKIGSLDVEIKGETVKILHANCPRQICRRSGAISGRRGQLVCAPNNVLIQIKPQKTDDVDAVAY